MSFEAPAEVMDDAGQQARNGAALQRLVKIMERLRDPVGGCEWDRVQTFETIAPYTIEEAYEVGDAIARGDMASLEDELGDLQLQVVFHSRMAEELGHFTIADVMNRICDKLERRHPHIFGDAAEGGHHLWEVIKAEERAAHPDSSALAGVALALPRWKGRRSSRSVPQGPDSTGRTSKAPRPRSARSWTKSRRLRRKSWRKRLVTCCSPSSTSHDFLRSIRKKL